jgi:hypothetical protein
MANYSSNITEALNTAMANITANNISSSNTSSLLINANNNNTSSSNSSALIRPMEWVQTNNCLCEAAEVCTRPMKYKMPPVCSHPDIGVNWQQYIRQPPVQQHSYRLEFGILIVLQAFFPPPPSPLSLILLFHFSCSSLACCSWPFGRSRKGAQCADAGSSSRIRMVSSLFINQKNFSIILFCSFFPEKAMQEMMEMVLKEHPHIHVRRGNEEMPPPLIVTCKFCRHKNGMDTPEVFFSIFISSKFLLYYFA